MSVRKKAIAAVAAVAAMVGMAACGSNNSGNGAVGEQAAVTYDDVQAALKSDKKVELTLWAWSVETMKPSIELFEKKYPNIKVKVVSTGASADHYTKLQNVIKAKKGLPDLVQLEYDALPQYAVQGALLNMNGEGIDENIGKLYNDAAWKNIKVGDGIYGIPQDQAPTAAWYRTDILEQYGIDIPTTWDEYEQAGIKLHQADPSKYLGFIDTSGSRQYLQTVRTADAQMWEVDGLKDITLNVANDNAKKATDFIQKLIDEGVLAAVPSGTDEFNRAWADGKYASWIDGAWRGGLFATQNPELKGKLKAAMVPSWGSADEATAGEAGGSLLSVTTAADTKEKQAAAIAFANWINSDPESIDAFQTVGGSLFCAAKAFQEDEKYAQVDDEYFGQKVNEIYFKAAEQLNTNWATLPYNNQMDSDFKDIVVPEIKEGGDMTGSLSKFQDKLKAYGDEQGFSVTVK